MDRMGLIAGNGPLPVWFARHARQQGISVVAVAHQGETHAELQHQVDRLTWIRVGELESLIQALTEGGVGQVVILGGIDKQRAMKTAKVDERGLRVLNDMAQRGDDALLGALARELEKEGMRVVNSQKVFESYLAPAGVMTRRAPDPREEVDLRLGIRALAVLGALDVGQTVVVKEGAVVAVEAVEGTDQAILRGGELGGAGAVVIKGSKPKQDMRFDVPVVGERTLETMFSVGATLLGMEAGRTILLERDRFLDLALEKGICLVGWQQEDVNEHH